MSVLRSARAAATCLSVRARWISSSSSSSRRVVAESRAGGGANSATKAAVSPVR